MLIEHNPCLFNDSRKNQRNKIKIFLRTCNSIKKMAKYQEVKTVKLTNTQFKVH